MKIKNDKGEEIEVFTAEEVAAREKTASEQAATKAVEEFKAQNPDKSQELEELKTKLADAEDLLKKAEEDGKSSGQIERLRKERDDAKKAAEEAQKGMDKKFEDFRKEIVGDTKKEMLDALSKGDAELRKKIEFEFDNYRPTATSKTDVKERMEKAFQLATGNKPTPGILDGRTGGGDRGDGGGYKPTEKKELTPNQRAIGTVLGITDKDRENYEKFKEERQGKKAAGLIPPDAN